jgi:maltose alpha-D-glucosyltransferase/alpha-amylase
LYYGDEIGMGDNLSLFDRNGVRTPMQWEATPTAGFSDAPADSFFAPVIDDSTFGAARVNVDSQRNDPNSLWHTIRKMIAVRKSHPAFGRGEFQWVDLPNEHIAAFERSYRGRSILAIHNLSDTSQSISLESKRPAAFRTDLLTNKTFDLQNIQLASYEFVWLVS